jgi:pimeloyl-ACP methyl ester carboxylesterase
MARTGNGWTISGSGGLGVPFDIVTNRFEAAYAADWQPQRLSMQGAARGLPFELSTTFGVTTAMNEVNQAGRRGQSSHQITSRAVVLPNGFFGSYEALAARLGDASAGTRLPIYAAPDGETSVTVERVTTRRLSLGTKSIDVRVFSLSQSATGTQSFMEIWTDERNRLARLELPELSIVVIRDDLASVMARTETVRHPGDEDVFIPANGFSLGATLTAPASPERNAAAVVLVAGAGPQDRDFTSYGVPVLGQLAGSLADAGYFVVRYDPRGIGRSGGRVENATVAEYADDVVHVVNWIRRRDDIHDDRIAIVGYADAGPIALTAAAREGRIKAVALVNAPGRNGRDVTIEQQRQILSRLNLPEPEQASRTALQHRVIDATITGKGWETIPAEIRRDADTPWFRSWLQFDPAAAFRRMKQPVLIVYGALDTEIPPEHADQLERLSAARDAKKPQNTRKVALPGVNHLLVPASTGSVEEYDTLETLTVSPEAGAAIAAWVRELLPPRR